MLATSALCGVLGTTLADDPAISVLTPAGFQRGSEVDLLITGARIGDVSEVLLYEPGVEVLALTPEGDNKVTAKLKLSDDCQPGLHAFRLATKTGISNLRYFGVSPLPQVAEVEPNNEFPEPQKLEMNSTVNGLCKTEDVDYYAVELAEGQKLTVELEGLRLGTDFFDPFVAILDENRFELSRSDDAPLLQQDCVCSFTAPKAGKYVIEVRESSFGGNDRAFYRLHVGDFPRPVAIVPAGGRPGEKIEAKIVDASGETWTETIQLPQEIGEFEYVSSHAGKVAPSPNRLRVIDMPNYLESEPDTDPAALTAVDIPAAFNGILQEQDDVDWFKIKGKKDQTLEYKVYGRSVLRSPIDSWLEIHKATGGRLAANDDVGGPDSTQSFKFPEDGEYLIAIRDQLNEGSESHAYRIEVSPPAASLALTIDELQRYVSQTVEVPQGAHMAVLLRAGRSNFGGDLGLRLENAPAGLELLTPTIAANQSYIPMLIKALPDAQPDAALANLVAETLPDGPGVIGNLNQRTMLVRGQNNRDVWGHDANKLAIAVTEALPFTIEAEQPKVPIVRSGSSHYVVRVKRNEGYAEAISLRVLYNPGGCSASGSVKIPGDKSEALIPLTANGNAAIGTYPITILARAKAKNANVWVATPFINLEVADSFFDYKFPVTVAETGQSGVVTVGLTVKSPPQGEVEFELVGLLAGVTSPNPKVQWKEGMEQLSFPIAVAADARVGQFKMLVVKATITRPEGTILQTQGTGELQIAAPVAPAAASVAANTPAPTPPPTAKPLSRLEQLRQAKGLLDK
ncbi:MAG: PPC domain-containing protein [Pirellulaceae bacterium]